MEVKTTGGIFTEEIKKIVINNITNVFFCEEEDIIELSPVQAGMTNIVLSFKVRGGKYIYRHPGIGSELLVERGRENLMQKIVEDIGIDKTLVATDVEEGWRISKYIEHRKFDYKNLNDMVRAIMLIKKLHETPCRVRWRFDIIKKAEELREKIDTNFYGKYEHFDEIRLKCYELNLLTQKDNIKFCNIHGDARDVNFLINDDEIYLIDWEYGGYGDPGFDIGSYICGGDHSIDDINKILFIYYRKPPTNIQKRHFYAYIALTGWFYLHWTMLKESKGQKVGINKILWYRYAKNFSDLALKMYREEIE